MQSPEESRGKFLRLAPAPSFADDDFRARLISFIVVSIIGLLITWFVYRLTVTTVEARYQESFQSEADQMQSRLQSQIDLSLEYLRAIPPFFQASDTVTKTDFSEFTAPAVTRHPPVHTFEWLPRVSDQDRKKFEENAAKLTGDAAFEIRSVNQAGNIVPSETRDVYFPVLFGEPLFKEVLGVDLLSHPEQGSYVSKARVANHLVATKPLSLIEEAKDDVLSVIVFAPVRLRDEVPTDDCNGLAIVILSVHDVVQDAFTEGRFEQFDIWLTDTEASENGTPFFNHSNESQSKHSLPTGWPSRELLISVADQTWNMKLAPRVGSKQYAPPPRPYWILISGLALSLLAGYSLSATVAIGGLRRKVDEALQLGQYRLGNKLGAGGMGVVYEAEHRMLARRAAIKLIRLTNKQGQEPDAHVRETRLNRFEKEAKATALLESPHTIGIYDFGKTPDGRFFYVMEFLSGIDLSTLVKNFGTLTPARIIYLMRQVCHSLAEAHDAGLIHRDIKPANIFVCRFAQEFDFVKVLDFGLVKSERDEAEIDITQPGALIGTPAFIAPEMLMGENVDHRADLYSLGCVMYYLLCGRPPFVGKTPTAVMAKHVTQKPMSLLEATDVGGMSKDFDDLILDCLAKRPADRPASAMELERRLAACAMAGEWTQEEAEVCWNIETEVSPESSNQETYDETHQFKTTPMPRASKTES